MGHASNVMGDLERVQEDGGTCNSDMCHASNVLGDLERVQEDGYTENENHAEQAQEGHPSRDLEQAQEGSRDIENSTDKKSEALEILLPRGLSSPDKATRTKALEGLGKWLCSCDRVEERHLTKIWYSIFCCVWHTSKGPAQVELGRIISNIFVCLTPELAMLTFKVLLSTMVKEWGGIDKKRIEKFRALLQLGLSQMLRLLQQQGWEEALLQRFVDAFGERNLTVNEGSQGVILFLVEAFVEELRRFLPPSPDILQMLLGPFLTVYATSTEKAVLQKVRDTVFVPLLTEARLSLRNKQDGEAEQGKCLGSLVLGIPLAGTFFELSSLPSVSPVNKKLLNQLYEEFSKSEKDSLPVDDLVPLELVDDQQESPVGRKRKRIGIEAPLKGPRILRSGQKPMGESDPTVLNLEEKLTSARGRSPSPSPGPSRRSPSRGASTDTDKEGEDEEGQRGSKRVRFSLKSNIVWTPHKPLPPQWVRLPACLAPRGSAMKPGVEPGPICEVQVPQKKTKKGKKGRRKGRKGGFKGKHL